MSLSSAGGDASDQGSGWLEMAENRSQTES
ncbi:hypothetical protein IW254_001951 [Corynebacterium aquatimens]|uniref:Uncharacterized protein n=1 Tax=Corynebacterium aquatimens TaxID=1190508 RepID=A0A931GTG3_9CORY|nr:hypothetical protein [Corynebacterium aquatimens]